jgi:ADP-ribose pyrophosphatase YjhB (NUDIX family)
MTLQVGVKIFLRNKEGKYLILRRSAERYPNLEKLWDIVGGRINPGSPLLANLEREIFEETALRMSDTPVLVYAQDIIRSDKHIVRLTYIGNAEGTPMLSAEETDYSWETRDELLKRPDLDEFAKEVLLLGLIP